jgi:hypothetical protein
MRLGETFTHIFFFISIWGSLRFFTVKTEWIYFTIILATLLSLVWVALFGYLHPELSRLDDTVLIRSDEIAVNTLIRRVGYQVEVALLSLLPFLTTKYYRN